MLSLFCAKKTPIFSVSVLHSYCKIRVKRFISFLLLLGFICSIFAEPYAEANFWQERRSIKLTWAVVPQTQPLNYSSVLFSLTTKKSLTSGPFSGSLAEVAAPYLDFISFSGSKSGPLVIQIQDVHQLAAAQKNIAAFLEALARKKTGLLIGVEGAEGRLEYLEKWRMYPEQKSLASAGRYLLRGGLITGAEAAGLASTSNEAEFFGLEDSVVYKQQVASFRETLNNSAIQYWLIETRERLKRLTARGYDSEWKELNTLRNKKDGNLNAWILRLWQILPSQNFPNISGYVTAADLEKKIDFTVVQRAQSKLSADLSRLLSTNELQILVQSAILTRLGQQRKSKFYETLEKFCKKSHLSFPSALVSYLKYQLIIERIDPEALFLELPIFESEALNKLAEKKSSNLRALHELVCDFELAEKALNFTMTPSDYKLLKKQRPFLNQLQERLFSLDAQKSLCDWNAVYLGLDHAEEFNRLSEERSKIFVQTWKSKISNQKSTLSVLIAGGYHSDGIARALQDEGAAVITLRPRLQAGDLADAPNPLAGFFQSPTPLEQAFLPERIHLAPQLALDGLKGEGTLAVQRALAAALLLFDPSKNSKTFIQNAVALQISANQQFEIIPAGKKISIWEGAVAFVVQTDQEEIRKLLLNSNSEKKLEGLQRLQFNVKENPIYSAELDDGSIAVLAVRVSAVKGWRQRVKKISPAIISNFLFRSQKFFAFAAQLLTFFQNNFRDVRENYKFSAQILQLFVNMKGEGLSVAVLLSRKLKSNYNFSNTLKKQKLAFGKLPLTLAKPAASPFGSNLSSNFISLSQQVNSPAIIWTLWRPVLLLFPKWAIRFLPTFLILIAAGENAALRSANSKEDLYNLLLKKRAILLTQMKNIYEFILNLNRPDGLKQLLLLYMTYSPQREATQNPLFTHRNTEVVNAFIQLHPQSPSENIIKKLRTDSNISALQIHQEYNQRNGVLSLAATHIGNEPVPQLINNRRNGPMFNRLFNILYSWGQAYYRGKKLLHPLVHAILHAPQIAAGKTSLAIFDWDGTIDPLSPELKKLLQQFVKARHTLIINTARGNYKFIHELFSRVPENVKIFLCKGIVGIKFNEYGIAQFIPNYTIFFDKKILMAQLLEIKSILNPSIQLLLKNKLLMNNNSMLKNKSMDHKTDDSIFKYEYFEWNNKQKIIGFQIMLPRLSNGDVEKLLNTDVIQKLKNFINENVIPENKREAKVFISSKRNSLVFQFGEKEDAARFALKNYAHSPEEVISAGDMPMDERMLNVVAEKGFSIHLGSQMRVQKLEPKVFQSNIEGPKGLYRALTSVNPFKTWAKEWFDNQQQILMSPLVPRIKKSQGLMIRYWQPLVDQFPNFLSLVGPHSKVFIDLETLLFTVAIFSAEQLAEDGNFFETEWIRLRNLLQDYLSKEKEPNLIYWVNKISQEKISSAQNHNFQIKYFNQACALFLSMHPINVNLEKLFNSLRNIFEQFGQNPSKALEQARTAHVQYNFTADIRSILNKENLNEADVPLLKELFNHLTQFSTNKNFNVNDEQTRIICLALKDNKTIKNLNLSHLNTKNDPMTYLGIMALSELLSTHQTLTTLNINFNRIGVQGAQALAKMLKINRTLEILELNGIGGKEADDEIDGGMNLANSIIGDDGAIALAEALEINSTLKSLSIYSQGINRLGVIAIFNALKVNKGLQNINIELQAVSEFENIADSLEAMFNSNRTLLSLTMNHFIFHYYEPSIEEGNKMAQAFRKIQVPLTLTFDSSWMISPEVAETFSNAIKNTPLKKLRFCMLSSEIKIPLKHFLQPLQNSSSLKSLTLENFNPLLKDNLDTLFIFFKNNQSVEEFEFEYNTELESDEIVNEDEFIESFESQLRLILQTNTTLNCVKTNWELSKDIQKTLRQNFEQSKANPFLEFLAELNFLPMELLSTVLEYADPELVSLHKQLIEDPFLNPKKIFKTIFLFEKLWGKLSRKKSKIDMEDASYFLIENQNENERKAWLNGSPEELKRKLKDEKLNVSQLNMDSVIGVNEVVHSIYIWKSLNLQLSKNFAMIWKTLEISVQSILRTSENKNISETLNQVQNWLNEASAHWLQEKLTLPMESIAMSNHTQRLARLSFLRNAFSETVLQYHRLQKGGLNPISAWRSAVFLFAQQEAAMDSSPVSMIERMKQTRVHAEIITQLMVSIHRNWNAFQNREIFSSTMERVLQETFTPIHSEELALDFTEVAQSKFKEKNLQSAPSAKRPYNRLLFSNSQKSINLSVEELDIDASAPNEKQFGAANESNLKKQKQKNSHSPSTEKPSPSTKRIYNRLSASPQKSIKLFDEIGNETDLESEEKKRNAADESHLKKQKIEEAILNKTTLKHSRLLSKSNVTINDVPSDGNCLFRAMALGLNRLEWTHETLRRQAADETLWNQIGLAKEYSTQLHNSFLSNVESYIYDVIGLEQNAFRDPLFGNMNDPNQTFPKIIREKIGPEFRKLLTRREVQNYNHLRKKSEQHIPLSEQENYELKAIEDRVNRWMNPMKNILSDWWNENGVKLYLELMRNTETKSPLWGSPIEIGILAQSLGLNVELYNNSEDSRYFRLLGNFSYNPQNPTNILRLYNSNGSHWQLLVLNNSFTNWVDQESAENSSTQKTISANNTTSSSISLLAYRLQLRANRQVFLNRLFKPGFLFEAAQPILFQATEMKLLPETLQAWAAAETHALRFAAAQTAQSPELFRNLFFHRLGENRNLLFSAITRADYLTKMSTEGCAWIFNVSTEIISAPLKSWIKMFAQLHPMQSDSLSVMIQSLFTLPFDQAVETHHAYNLNENILQTAQEKMNRLRRLERLEPYIDPAQKTQLLADLQAVKAELPAVFLQTEDESAKQRALEKATYILMLLKELNSDRNTPDLRRQLQDLLQHPLSTSNELRQLDRSAIRAQCSAMAVQGTPVQLPQVQFFDATSSVYPDPSNSYSENYRKKIVSVLKQQNIEPVFIVQKNKTDKNLTADQAKKIIETKYKTFHENTKIIIIDSNNTDSIATLKKLLTGPLATDDFRRWIGLIQTLIYQAAPQNQFLLIDPIKAAKIFDTSA